MNEQTNSSLTIIATLLLIFVFSVGLGVGLDRTVIRKSAIKAGVGEYYFPNKTSNHAEFRWVTETNNFTINISNVSVTNTVTSTNFVTLTNWVTRTNIVTKTLTNTEIKLVLVPYSHATN